MPSPRPSRSKPSRSNRSTSKAGDRSEAKPAKRSKAQSSARPPMVTRDRRQERANQITQRNLVPEPKQAPSRAPQSAKRKSGSESERRRRDSENNRPTRRTQPARAQNGKNSMIPIIVIVIVVILGIGAATFTTGETKPPLTPEEQAWVDFENEADLIKIAIQGFQYDEANERQAALKTRLDSPLLKDKRGEGDALLAELKLTLARKQLDDVVGNRALELQKGLKDLICEPELDQLEADIDRFVANPIAACGQQAVDGYDPSHQVGLLNDAKRLIGKERDRRKAGFVPPRFPSEHLDNMAARAARRDYQNVEKSVAANLKAGHFDLAFEQIRKHQEKYPDYDFKPLWTQTTTALEKAWPGIKQASTALIDKALASGSEDDKANARFELRKSIRHLGDERLMAELRPQLLELR